MQFACEVAIEKVDPEQRIVWGWAYVCEQGGEPVADVSGQSVAPAEMQRAAHAFVRDSRVGGLLHKARAGEVVDSIFFSSAVQKALGIELGRVGWFVGVHVQSDPAWAGVRDGTYKAFSIAGEAEEGPYV